MFRAGCCLGFLGLLHHDLDFLSYFRSVAFHSLLLGCHHNANLFHQLPLLDNRMGVRDSWCGQ
jgi:hypothetical protein